MLALLEDGLASPLLAQIVEGIRNLVAMLRSIILGQIVATSHDLTSKGSSGREITLFPGNLGW